MAKARETRVGGSQDNRGAGRGDGRAAGVKAAGRQGQEVAKALETRVTGSQDDQAAGEAGGLLGRGRLRQRGGRAVRSPEREIRVAGSHSGGAAGR